MTGELTVSQFNEIVKSTIQTAGALNDIVVVGEISEYKPASSGHVYPTLKDSRSVIHCTMFRSVVSRLTFRPQVGMKVVVFGSASYYPPSGSLSFNILGMAPFGEGEEKRKLEELTNRLLKEGLFDPERKRQLPRYPKVIGVVTSRTGAVIKDIIDTASRRFPADILLAPAKVQGEGADASIVKGIELLNRAGADVIIVGRGGGSAEDLSAFNSEIVVRAVVASKAPVISAVGHATDKSLTDRAADRYAETPTMAAAIATVELEGELQFLESLEGRMRRSMSASVDRMRMRFAVPDARLDPSNAMERVKRLERELDSVSQHMRLLLERSVASARASFDRADARLDPRRAAESVSELLRRIDVLSDAADRSAVSCLERCGTELEKLSVRLNSDSPYSVLERGYSYITDGSGTALTSVGSLHPGASVSVRMRDGTATAEIKEVNRNG